MRLDIGLNADCETIVSNYLVDIQCHNSLWFMFIVQRLT